MRPSDVLAQMAGSGTVPLSIRLLYLWMRFVVPGAILAVGLVWVLAEVFGVTFG